MTLRIQKSVQNELVVFKLIGRIQADDIPDLLATLRFEAQGCAVLMDLSDVKLVDRCAVLFLALKESAGVRLKNCAPYIRQWIDQEKGSLGCRTTDDPTDSAK